MPDVPGQTRPLLADLVRELTEPHSHSESFSYATDQTTYAGRHVTNHPSLLAQLAAATQMLGNADDGIRLGYGSRPSARLDAIDTLSRIDGEARSWFTATVSSTEAAVRLAASFVPSVHSCGHACRDQTPECDRTCCHRHELDWQVRRWYTWSRLVTGWDRPAWRPDASCPACGKRGGLRVRIDEDQQNAMCTECHATWTEDNIDRLAFHIKAEAECAAPGCDQRATRARLIDPDQPDGPTRRVCTRHAVVDFTPVTVVTSVPLGEVSADAPTPQRAAS